MTIATLGIAGQVRPKFARNDETLTPFVDGENDSPSLVRREMYDGRVHTVVPCVLAVAGVLNDALVSAEELARSAESWNGRDVPVLHPEDRGQPISVAESPSVLERAVGRVFFPRMDGDKLKAELWLDEMKVDRLGYSEMLAAMVAGEIVEVSTGYIADDVLEAGEFRGRPYSTRHVNIRPDHLALLPGQIGACSIEDGCGAPRINQRRGVGVKINEALDTIAKALGISHRNNCNCEACAMKTVEQKRKDVGEKITTLKLIENKAFVAAADTALGLKANDGLGSKHLKMLEELDEKGLDMMSAMIEAYRTAGAKAAAEEPPPGGDDDEAAKAAAAKAAAAKQNAADGKPITITAGELKTLIANEVSKAVATQVPEQARRTDVTAKLKANEANPFSDEQLKTLPVDALEAVEQKLRPVDYSGAGGFNTHGSGADDEEPLALTINRQREERAAARRGDKQAA